MRAKIYTVILNGFAYALSLAIIIMSLTAAYFFLAPIDVLKDWRLTVRAGTFNPGEAVTIESSYEKVRDVTGVSKRYIECKNQNDVYIRYPLNEADANRQIGTGGTGVIVTIPREIAEVALPTTCRFNIVIDYKVYSFRTVTEKNTSREFTLEKSQVTTDVKNNQ